MSWWKSLLGTGATIGASALGGPAAGAAAGGAMGLWGNMDKHKKQQETANLRAAEIEASPWTGRSPTTAIDYAGPEAADAMAGAASGFAMGENFNKAAGPAAAGSSPTAISDGASFSPSDVADMGKGAQDSYSFFDGANPGAPAGAPSMSEGQPLNWGGMKQYAMKKPSLYSGK